MSASGGVVLGFDYGTRRIGVAVGQRLTGSARPVETVAVHARGPDWGRIAHLVGDWRPERLVVGLPLNMDASPQAMTAAAERFGRQLAGRYRLPVETVDERLSTREAAALLEEAGRPVRDLDGVAASLILETWMREHPPQ